MERIIKQLLVVMVWILVMSFGSLNNTEIHFYGLGVLILLELIDISCKLNKEENK